MPLFLFTGNAVITSLDANITNAQTSFDIGDGTGWPLPSGAQSSVATIGDPANGDTEEKILFTSRSGATLSGITRGYDGTAAQAWPQGTRIRHTISAVFANESSAHVNDPTRNDHTQYLRTTDHATLQHTDAMIGTDSVGTDELKNNAVETANINDLAVTTGKLADLGVTSAKLGTDAVIAGKIADAAIDDHALFSADTQPFIVSASDPGAVGANKIWFDTTNRRIWIRNAGNSGWDLFAELISPRQSYTPALGTGMTEGGTGIVRSGEFFTMGDMVLVNMTWAPGTLGNVAAGNPIALGLPPGLTPDPARRYGMGGRVNHASLGEFAGAGIITSGLSGFVTNFAYFGGIFDATHPINWGNPGDGNATLDVFGYYYVA